jgi:hypothetical protein
MDERNKLSFEFAAEGTKQLITLAFTLVTAGAAFSKDIVQAVPTGGKVAFIVTLFFYTVSVIGGVATLFAMAGSLAPLTIEEAAAVAKAERTLRDRTTARTALLAAWRDHDESLEAVDAARAAAVIARRDVDAATAAVRASGLPRPSELDQRLEQAKEAAARTVHALHVAVERRTRAERKRTLAERELSTKIAADEAAAGPSRSAAAWGSIRSSPASVPKGAPAVLRAPVTIYSPNMTGSSKGQVWMFVLGTLSLFVFAAICAFGKAAPDPKGVQPATTHPVPVAAVKQ